MGRAPNGTLSPFYDPGIGRGTFTGIWIAEQVVAVGGLALIGWHSAGGAGLVAGMLLLACEALFLWYFFSRVAPAFRRAQPSFPLRPPMVWSALMLASESPLIIVLLVALAIGQARGGR